MSGHGELVEPRTTNHPCREAPPRGQGASLYLQEPVERTPEIGYAARDNGALNLLETKGGSRHEKKKDRRRDRTGGVCQIGRASCRERV